MGAAVTFLYCPLSCGMHSSLHPGTGNVWRSFPGSYRAQPKESCEKLVSSQNYLPTPACQHTQVLYELVIMHIVILLLEFTELLLKLCPKVIVAVHVCKGKLYDKGFPFVCVGGSIRIACMFLCAWEGQGVVHLWRC